MSGISLGQEHGSLGISLPTPHSQLFPFPVPRCLFDFSWLFWRWIMLTESQAKSNTSEEKQRLSRSTRKKRRKERNENQVWTMRKHTTLKDSAPPFPLLFFERILLELFSLGKFLFLLFERFPFSFFRNLFPIDLFVLSKDQAMEVDATS